jgi:23S rRNA (cytosine1962-C5)-methyltransferase
VSEPWVRFEDEHLLVVAKPAGVNTHRADAHAQDGMVEWVQRQRPAASLSVLHRLDKATSGLLLFGKSRLANQSLAAQFEGRRISKTYELLARRDDRRPHELSCAEPIAGQEASTDFALAASGTVLQRYNAHPHTGRTRQVRVHAAAVGMPIVGDEELGGDPAARLLLHAAGLGFEHPTVGPMELASGRPESFARALAASSLPDLTAAPLAALAAHEARATLFDPSDTDAYLWIDRHHDGFPDTRVERLGDVALVLSYGDGPVPAGWLDAWSATLELRAVYEQRRPRGGSGGPAQLVAGTPQPRFEVTELGCRYLLDLEASGTSSGLFLDQREARRRLLASDLTGRTVLNTFAHTGSLSVAAAKAGAETLTLDLSKRYLDWARDNLRGNGLDPADHDFMYGDALEWLDRFAKQGRAFDVVIVDPPSSSTPRRGGRRWVVDRDLHGLVERAARVCAPGGTLFVSTNLRSMDWARFDAHLERGLAAAGRRGAVDHQTLPLDHRSGRGDPPYLKTAWVTLDRAKQ